MTYSRRTLLRSRPSSHRLMKVTLHVVRNVCGLGSGLSANVETSHRDSGEGRGLCRGARHRARGGAQLAACTRYVSTRAPDTDRADFAKGTTARLAGAEVPKYADEEQAFAELKARITKRGNSWRGSTPH